MNKARKSEKNLNGYSHTAEKNRSVSSTKRKGSTMTTTNTTNSPAVRIVKVFSNAELYSRSNNDTEPRQCHLALDVKAKELFCLDIPENDGFLCDGENPRPKTTLLKFPIPVLTGEAANRLMKKVKPIAESIIKGCSVIQNYRGEHVIYSPDALRAVEEIRQLCKAAGTDHRNRIHELDAAEFLKERTTRNGDRFVVSGPEGKQLVITAETTDSDLIDYDFEIITGGWVRKNENLNDTFAVLAKYRDELKTA